VIRIIRNRAWVLPEVEIAEGFASVECIKRSIACAKDAVYWITQGGEFTVTGYSAEPLTPPVTRPPKRHVNAQLEDFGPGAVLRIHYRVPSRCPVCAQSKTDDRHVLFQVPWEKEEAYLSEEDEEAVDDFLDDLLFGEGAPQQKVRPKGGGKFRLQDFI
jgi:hypothetical protein